MPPPAAPPPPFTGEEGIFVPRNESKRIGRTWLPGCWPKEEGWGGEHKSWNPFDVIPAMNIIEQMGYKYKEEDRLSLLNLLWNAVVNLAVKGSSPKGIQLLIIYCIG